MEGRGEDRPFESGRDRQECLSYLEIARSSIPEAAEFVSVEDRVIAEERKILGLGLSDEHAVEGIFVRAGEESGAGGVRASNR